jgi:hypothetical protein
MNQNYEEMPNKKLIKLAIHRSLFSPEKARNTHRKDLIKALRRYDGE